MDIDQIGTSGAEIGSFSLGGQVGHANFLEKTTKRACDIAAAVAAIICLAPILLITALAIKLDSPGPVIFRQRRIGMNGYPFIIYKFRTMTVAEDGSKIAQAQRDDPRVTKVGRLLRQSSIDELPQFMNVLRGEMSLVGPRPLAVAHDEHYCALLPDYPLRRQVKPGITGWAQINGSRGETASLKEMERRVKLDLWYIDHQSFSLDLQIAWRTCIEVARWNAY